MKKFLFAIVTSALIIGETLAIEPVYDGEDGNIGTSICYQLPYLSFL